MRNGARAFVLAGCALLAAHCGAPRDPVTECLKGAVAAAENRDADGVMARVAEGFRGMGVRIGASATDIRIVAGGDAARGGIPAPTPVEPVGVA